MSSSEIKPKRKIALKKNKEIDKIWHPESGLVFKSSTEKLVIGRFKDGEVIPLDDEALDLCTQWKFKYDTSLVEEVDEEEGDEEEGDEEDEEDENDEKFDETKNEKVIDGNDKLKNEGLVEVFGENTKDVESDIDEKVKVLSNYSVPDTTFEIQLKDSFTEMDESTKLLRKNIDMILKSFQQKMNEEIATLTKELEDTKSALAQMTSDCDEAKAKFAKIRSALGL